MRSTVDHTHTHTHTFSFFFFAFWRCAAEVGDTHKAIFEIKAAQKSPEGHCLHAPNRLTQILMRAMEMYTLVVDETAKVAASMGPGRCLHARVGVCARLCLYGRVRA